MKKRIFASLTCLLLAAVPAFANQSTVELRGEVWDDAKGEAVISDVDKDLKEIKITASGLEPNSMFSVWLINETPLLGEYGIGAGDLTFESDVDGKAVYTARVPSEQFKDWDKIEVMQHPDNNSDDMENAEIALVGSIG